MKTIYRIYRYDATAKIPHKFYNRNDCYTADEVDRIIMEDAYSGDCFLFDNVILETEDKAEAESRLAKLTPYSELLDGGKIDVTCYGVEEFKYDIDDDGEITDEESVGGNWKFAPIETSEDEDEDED